MNVARNIKTLALFNFFTDFKLYAPVMILYFTKVTGSLALGMSIFSIAMISAALFEVPTGVFSDFIGRRKTVILGALSSVAAVTFYAVGHWYWALAVGALFEGLSRSFYSGNNAALLHETLAQTNDEHKYDEYLGKVSSMFQMALAVSAVFGSVIAFWSYAVVMWLSVIPQVICLFLSFRLIEPKVHLEESGNVYLHLKEAFINLVKNKKLRLLSIEDFYSFAIGESSFLFRSAFVNTLWPVWAIGFVSVLTNIAASASFWFSGRIIKRFGAFQLQFLTSFYNRTINIIALSFPTVVSPVIMSSNSLWYGISKVASNTLMQKEFTDKQRATIPSLNSLAGNILFGIFAPILGLLGDRFGAANALLISQFVILPTLIINFYLFRKYGKEERMVFN